MELFLAGALVGIVASSVWSTFLRPLARRGLPAPPPEVEPPKLPPVRGRRRK